MSNISNIFEDYIGLLIDHPYFTMDDDTTNDNLMKQVVGLVRDVININQMILNGLKKQFVRTCKDSLNAFLYVLFSYKDKVKLSKLYFFGNMSYS